MTQHHEPTAQTWKIVTAAGIGTAFELYDFTLFAFFAIAIAPAFFPVAKPGASLMLTMATFGIGAVMRPIGALVLGAYGDRVGRKTILSITLVLMAVGSIAIGIVPKYQTIGIAAPVIVILARMIQGFSAGGEQGSAATFVVEQVPERHRGWYLGFLGTASLGATFFSTGFALALNRLLGAAAMADWGWRIPFLFGGLIAPAGWYIRSRLPESEIFTRNQANLHDPGGQMRRRPGLSVHTVILVMAAFIPGTIINYLAMIYMPTYLHTKAGVTLDLAFKAVFVAALVVAVGMPLIGGLSDRIGRRPILMVGYVGLFLLSYPLYRALQHAPGIGTLLLVECSFAAVLILTSAPLAPFAADHFPTIGRSLGMSLGMTVPIAIFGICSPIIVIWLMNVLATPLAPAFYMMAAAAAGLLAILALPERPLYDTYVAPR